MAGSMGHQARLCTDSTGVDTASEPFEFISETLTKKTEILDTNGIRGTRSHHSARTRFGINRVDGTITMHPSPNDLEIWLPRILGSGAAIAETLPTFLTMIDRVEDAFLYTGCVVSKATFRGSPNNFIEMALDIVALSETSGQAFPALSLGVAADDAPYVFSDLTLSLLSSSRSILDFELVIDNAAQARHLNSRNATDILLTDRLVSLNVNTPWTSSYTDLHDQALAGATGSLTWTNGAVSTAWTFGVVQSAPATPGVSSRTGEIVLNVPMMARMVSTTAEIAVTNDATP